MHFISFVLFFSFISIHSTLELEQYRTLREQCARTPPPAECLQLKSKFLQILEKCQQINTRQQAILCQQVKDKLCAVFTTTCAQAKTSTTTKSTSKTPKKQIKPKISTTTTKKTDVTTMSNEEFIQVPVNPEELRTRGEYCIRHGKEKKCQQLLNNLKNTYSTCNKKKPSTQPKKIDCHSFQTHLCKAFPKFPPCIKKAH